MSYYLSSNPGHTIVGGLRGLFRFLRFLWTFAAVAALVIAWRAVVPLGWRNRHARQFRRWLGTRLSNAAAVRVRTSGRLPGGIAMIVSNHLSWLDSFVLLGELGPRFVAGVQWAGIPPLAAALRSTGVLFIDRTRLRDSHRVGSSLRRLMSRGEVVMVYPEATTSSGASVMPFRGALLEPLAECGLSAGWVVLRYETPRGWPPASVVVAWTDWTMLLVHMYRAFHPPYLIAELTFGDSAITRGDRKEMAAALHAAVSAALVPMEQLPPDQLSRILVPPREPQPSF